jgi:hypothetical protein
MMKDLRDLYERLRGLPWPTLGATVGDFALYEALLAGCADTAVRGGTLDMSKVPEPDEETINKVRVLQKKDDPTSEEKAFLDYFELLEEIRLALGGS